ncbi:serine hydrolase domain-containing protein [Nocardioides sp. GCM10027113]|uniref:serine hydrolase domain-containing protein n=1 Tax=unclassified Nocardioides TaxID=2615069 RepID=UPI00362109DA
MGVPVVEGGVLREAHAQGVLAAGTSAAVGTRTMFHAASISKLVTALGVLRLAGESALDLDEDVNERLRAWRLPSDEHTRRSPVTLRLLLSHQAGLVDPEDSFGPCAPGQSPPSLGEVLRGSTAFNPAPVRPVHAPGNRFSYSDAGYCVVEQLLTDVTGEPFPTLMADLVLRPLGMDRSQFGLPDPAEDVVELHDALAGSGRLGITPHLAEGMVRGQGRTPWAGLGTFLGSGGDSGEQVVVTSMGWGVGFQCMLRARVPPRGPPWW